MPLLAALLLTALVPDTPVTARLQVQTGAWMYQGGELSPDGRLLATINGGNQGAEPPALWEVETGRQILTFEAPPSGLTSAGLSFSKDQTRLAGFSHAGLLVWDTKTGKLVEHWEEADDAVMLDGGVAVRVGRMTLGYDLMGGDPNPIVDVPGQSAIVLVDLDRVLAVEKDGTARLYRGDDVIGSFKLKRTPSAVIPCGPNAVAANMIYFPSTTVDPSDPEKRVTQPGEYDWAVLDTSSQPTKSVEFKASRVVPVADGLVVINDGKAELRKSSAWSQAEALPLPESPESVFALQDGRTLAAIKSGDIHLLNQDTRQKRELKGAETLLLMGDFYPLPDGGSFVGISSFVAPYIATVSLQDGSTIREFDALAAGPGAISLGGGGTRLAVGYGFSSEEQTQLVWDLDTGRAKLVPGSLIELAYPNDSANEILVQRGDKVSQIALLTNRETELLSVPELKEMSVLGAFTDLVIARDEEKGMLLAWQADPIGKTAIPYEMFFSVGQTRGSKHFWVCVDGKVFFFGVDDGSSEVYGEASMPHIDAALEKSEKETMQFVGANCELSATPDDELLLQVGYANFFRLLGETVNDGVASDDFGSVTLFHRSTKTWETMDIGDAIPMDGELTKSGKLAYVTTKQSRLLRINTETKKVEAELPLDSPAGDIALDEDRGFAFVQTQNGVTVVDLRGWKAAATLVALQEGNWAVVAPDGRFDASELDGLEGLYWVFSDDPYRPMPIEVLMRDYYEPRLLSRILAREKLPDLKPVTEVARDLPRVAISEVKLLDDAKVDVKVTVDAAQTTGAHDLRLFRDGQLVAQTDGVVSGSGVKEIWFRGVQVPQQGEESLTFSAYAFNADRAKSESARAVVKTTQPKKKGRAFIMTVGVNSYEDSTWNLTFAANDARAMAWALEASMNESKAFEEVFPGTLISDKDEMEATKKNVKDAIAELADNVTPEDLVVFHWAGHGYAAPDGKFYLIPSDTGAKFDVSNPAHLARAVSTDDLAEWLRPVDAAQIVMMIDACHSAATVQAEGFKPGPMGARGLGQLAFDKGMMILAATQAADVALESDQLGHGLMTFSAVVAGLIGDDEGGLVFRTFSKDGKTASFRDLFDFTAYLVPLLHQEIQDGKRQIARTGRVSYTKDKRAGSQKPEIFDFSRREPGLVLGKG